MNGKSTCATKISLSSWRDHYLTLLWGPIVNINIARLIILNAVAVIVYWMNNMQDYLGGFHGGGGAKCPPPPRAASIHTVNMYNNIQKGLNFHGKSCDVLLIFNPLASHSAWEGARPPHATSHILIIVYFSFSRYMQLCICTNLQEVPRVHAFTNMFIEAPKYSDLFRGAREPGILNINFVKKNIIVCVAIAIPDHF